MNPSRDMALASPNSRRPDGDFGSDPLKGLYSFIISSSEEVRGGWLRALPDWKKCVIRTSNRGVLCVVSSKYCKWCRARDARPSEPSFRYLLLLQNCSLEVELQKHTIQMLHELIRALDPECVNAVNCQGPFFTIENVNHVSDEALQLLLSLDSEFLWGHNVTLDLSV